MDKNWHRIVPPAYSARICNTRKWPRLNTRAVATDCGSSSQLTGLFEDSVGVAVAERLDRLPPAKAVQVRSLAGPRPDFRKWESCRTMSLVGGIFSGISRFLRPCIPALLPIPYSPYFTLIGSRDLVVKSRRNSSTHPVGIGVKVVDTQSMSERFALVNYVCGIRVGGQRPDIGNASMRHQGRCYRTAVMGRCVVGGTVS
ncbi:hypothetical protein PR048_021563 [Dryococelus australis]|uniref:Uncharacterized protein n=1 Tax=Dryococelus australis TaxID=614101 RepID=A0ABQ9GYJ1_9NEOP|nr:hypothetical protein PR048_021563 [Dryococelus australis]